VFLFTICKLKAMAARHTFSIRSPVFALGRQVNLAAFCVSSRRGRVLVIPLAVHVCSRRTNQAQAETAVRFPWINACAVRYLVRIDRAKSRAAKCAVSQLVAARCPACASTSSRRHRSGTKEPRPRIGFEWPGRVREEPQDFSTNALRAI